MRRFAAETFRLAATSEETRLYPQTNKFVNVSFFFSLEIGVIFYAFELLVHMQSRTESLMAFLSAGQRQRVQNLLGVAPLTSKPEDSGYEIGTHAEASLYKLLRCLERIWLI